MYCSGFILYLFMMHVLWWIYIVFIHDTCTVVALNYSQLPVYVSSYCTVVVCMCASICCTVAILTYICTLKYQYVCSHGTCVCLISNRLMKLKVAA